jgi:hypothetical protein
VIRRAALAIAFVLYAAGVLVAATTDWTARANTGDQPPPAAVASAPAPHHVPAALSPQNSLRERLVEELNATDPGRALADLERATRADPHVARYCHPVAHELGHAALAKYHGDFATAARFRNDVCGSGYLHGLVEEKLSQSPDPARDVTALCAPQQSASCVHGIGHGAMFVSHLNVAGAEGLCSRFTTGDAVTACSEGIFMQLFEPDESDPKAMANLPSDRLTAEPLYPCPEQPAAFRGGCYYYAPVYFLQRHDYARHPEAYAAGLAWCRNAPVADGGRDACTMGLGSRIMKYNIDREQWSADQCEKAPAQQLRPCFAGLVSYYRVHYHDRAAADRLCAKLSGRSRSHCRQAAAGSTSAAD